tara:strand:+ start:1038 stop:1964 length:927 start_codon:yes stop_codon:yes gene_type:complete
MLTRIFSKSKPINFVIVFFIILLAFSVANVKLFIQTISFGLFLENTTWFLTCWLLIFLFNFIVVKNSLTKRNHYQILLFGLFFLAFPQTTVNENILLANLFFLFGFRRILSLRSQIRVKKKLFDAAFWFGIATLFYFWAILFVVVIFGALLLYTDNRLKNWIVPFVGLVTVFVISISLSVIFYDDFFEILKIPPTLVSYNYTGYNSAKDLIAITLLFSFGGWSAIHYVKIFQKKKRASRPSYKVVFITVIIAFIIAILAPQKNGGEFLFLFTPLAIIITNYIESIKEKWFKELFLDILILVPFLLLML